MTGDHTKHCIYGTAATKRVVVNTKGNGFGELGGGYVPTSDEAYVKFDIDVNSLWTVYDVGNDYMTEAARPDYRGLRAVNSNSLPYASGYVQSNGTIEGACNNIVAVSKLTTGRYKIDFSQIISARKMAFIAAPSGFTGGVFTSDNGSITVDLFSLSTNTLTDVEFGIMVYTTGKW